nr:PKD domain-containing protein [Candidatus Sigynarchaeota archaeon]
MQNKNNWHILAVFIFVTMISATAMMQMMMLGNGKQFNPFSSTFTPSIDHDADDSPIYYPYYYLTSPNFTWVNMSSAVRCDLEDSDDEYQEFDLPFLFNFFNAEFSKMYVCTNGFVSFIGQNDWALMNFPTSEAPFMVAPYWCDLVADVPCNIFVMNATDNDSVIIEWNNVSTFGENLVGTFQVVLDSSGDIYFNYLEILFTGYGYTCGLNLGTNLNFYHQYTGLTSQTVNKTLKFNYDSSDGGKLNLKPFADFTTNATQCSLALWKEYYADFSSIDMSNLLFINNASIGENIQFYFTGTDGNGPADVFWNFGDGSFSFERNPVTFYLDYGIYLVELEVNDQD